jgi:ABC-type multidrug transport system ATPase subunit
MITAENVTVRFHRGWRRKARKALDGFNLQVRAGDFVALLGSNGAGKSTAIHCFLGLLRPTSGAVRVLGKPPRHGGESLSRVAYLPEEPHYPGYLTVDEALLYYGRLFGRRPPASKIRALLESVDLEESRSLRIAKCSKGMKQKLGIAACLLNDPELMFLDEPMRGLDPKAVRDFRAVLVERNRQGTTIVMSSHILAEVEMVARRAAILNAGKVVREGPVEELRASASPRYHVEFQGLPPEQLDLVLGATTSDGVTHGSVLPERLGEFLQVVQSDGRRLLACALEKSSLEESYLSILRGNRPDA